MKTQDFIIDKQEAVLNHFGLQVTGNRHLPECPFCSGKKKFRVGWYNGNIRGICTCNSWSLLDLIIDYSGKDFKTVAAEIDRQFGNTDYTPEQKPKTANAKRDKAIQLFKASSPIKGTQAQEYLNSRGIFEMPTGGVKYGQIKGGRDCLIALATTEFSEPRMLHTTHLKDGQKYGDKPRLMHSLAPQEDGAPISIKLFEAGSVLGVAEGIESALSAKQLYKVPTWSCMNATFIKKFRAPTGVEVLYIFADNDSGGTGLAAAFECGRANIYANNDVTEVRILWPENLCDFNDLIQEGDTCCSWILKR